MSEPFLIAHPDGRTFELNDPAYFVSHYQPQGFAVVDPAPTGYGVPDLTAADTPIETDPHKMTRGQLNDFATRIGIDGAAAYPNKDSLLIEVDAWAQQISDLLPNAPGHPGEGDT